MIKIENVKLEKEENGISTVYAEITAPLWWWDKFDGCVDHETVIPIISKIMVDGVDFDDFSNESIYAELSTSDVDDIMSIIITRINEIGEQFVKIKADEKDSLAKRKKLAELFRQVEQLMPRSYNVTSKVVLDYEILSYLYKRYRNHFDEWDEFCKWVKTLPDSEKIIFKKGE